MSFLKKILQREREHMHEWGAGAWREGERESQADSTLSVETDMELDPTTRRSCPELKSSVGHSTD